jgi:hypothetical protein
LQRVKPRRGRVGEVEEENVVGLAVDGFLDGVRLVGDERLVKDNILTRIGKP